MTFNQQTVEQHFFFSFFFLKKQLIERKSQFVHLLTLEISEHKINLPCQKEQVTVCSSKYYDQPELILKNIISSNWLKHPLSSCKFMPSLSTLCNLTMHEVLLIAHKCFLFLFYPIKISHIHLKILQERGVDKQSNFKNQVNILILTSHMDSEMT